MYDFDDNDDTDLGQSGSGDLVSDLRKALRAKDRELKTLTDKYAEVETVNKDLTTKVNAINVAKILEAKGVKPGVSKFLKDVEPTEEAITAWLADNGELIGYDPNAKAGSGDAEGGDADGESEENLTPEMQAMKAAMSAVQKQEANAAPGTLKGSKELDPLERIAKNATSFADVVDGLKQMGAIPDAGPTSRH